MLEILDYAFLVENLNFENCFSRQPKKIYSYAPRSPASEDKASIQLRSELDRVRSELAEKEQQIVSLKLALKNTSQQEQNEGQHPKPEQNERVQHLEAKTSKLTKKVEEQAGRIVELQRSLKKEKDTVLQFEKRVQDIRTETGEVQKRSKQESAALISQMRTVKAEQDRLISVVQEAAKQDSETKARMAQLVQQKRESVDQLNATTQRHVITSRPCF